MNSSKILLIILLFAFIQLQEKNTTTEATKVYHQIEIE